MRPEIQLDQSACEFPDCPACKVRLTVANAINAAFDAGMSPKDVMDQLMPMAAVIASAVIGQPAVMLIGALVDKPGQAPTAAAPVNKSGLH